MPYLYLLFLAHLLLLIIWSWRTARRIFSSDLPVLLATFLLAWTNLVHTAQLASMMGLLDVPVMYFAISLAVSAGYRKFFGWACPEPVPSDGISFAETVRQISGSRFSLVLLAGLILAAIGAVLIAISVLPNNWDTLAYRFPRVNFYLTTGALVHSDRGMDDRALYYPYNGSLLYLMLAQYQLPGITWNLVSVFGWFMAGFGAFYLPLQQGGSVRGGMYSAYALLTAPIVLCLATSTNDELLAGAPLLLGVIFLLEWFKSRALGSLLFGMIGVAISVGVKLHLMFYFPALLLGAALAARFFRREVLELWKEALQPYIKVAAAGFMLALPLAVGFMVTNLISAGRITNTRYNKQVLNAPFHPGAAAQNVVLLTSQLFLSPLPDHARIFGMEKGEAAYRSFNELTNKTLFKNVKQGPPYTSPFYNFRGINSPLAAFFFEETLWMGMVPWAVLVAIIWMIAERKQQTIPLWVLMLSLPLWHLALCIIHLYVECIGTYYAYSAPVGLAALGLVWERMGKSGSTLSKVASGFLVLVLVSNTLLAGTLLLSSPKRNVTSAFRTGGGESDLSQTSEMVKSTFARAKQVYLTYTHWEYLYWNFMRLNPSARYYSGDYPASAKIDLFVWSYYSRFAWDKYTPVPIRASRMGEFKYLGTMSNGGEVVICGGPTCLTECPNCEDMFLMPLKMERKGPAIELFVEGPSQGLSAAQEGFVRFTLFNSQTQANSPSAWVPLGSLASFKTTVQDQGFDHVLVETSCESGPTCLISRTTLPMNPGLRPLVDQMPEFSPSLDTAQISAVFGNGWEGTEGSGYWKFRWKLRPGTNKLDATWTGGGGEKASDELTVSLITETQVKIHRKGYNSYYVGTWFPSKNPAAKGYAAWDPNNIWQGRRVDPAPVTAKSPR